MDAGSEAADLMVREGLQITEATIKLLAAGSKNLAAFLYALAKDNKRVSGKTNMGRLLREGKELRIQFFKTDTVNKICRQISFVIYNDNISH